MDVTISFQSARATSVEAVDDVVAKVKKKLGSRKDATEILSKPETWTWGYTVTMQVGGRTLTAVLPNGNESEKVVTEYLATVSSEAPLSQSVLNQYLAAASKAKVSLWASVEEGNGTRSPRLAASLDHLPLEAATKIFEMINSDAQEEASHFSLSKDEKRELAKKIKDRLLAKTS